MNTLKAEVHLQIWKTKPILQRIYQSWYKKISAELTAIPDGPILDIGSGCGNAKAFIPDIIVTDIQNSTLVDIRSDAQWVPFKDDSISAITMVDVLHHIPHPDLFIHEASRVLKTNGRIVIIEPYPTFFSNIFYTLFHSEPMRKDASILLSPKNFSAPNQAASFILFKKERKYFNSIYSQKCTLERHNLFASLIYPLSGGYKKYSLIPVFLVPFFEKLEQIISPFNFLFAFRSFTVIKKLRF
jgi:SAM-dependent methyltransferase